MDIITEEINNINDNLTALQRAQRKYYEKNKHNPDYILKRRAKSTKHYNKIKDDPEFKRKVSEQKKEYYMKKKVEILLEIIV